MKLSHRIATINGENVTDDGWSVLYKARDMMEEGIAITSLSIGDHDTHTPDFILDAMDASVRNGNTRLCPKFRRAQLAQTVANRGRPATGIATNLENTFITTGGQGALFAAMMGATDPGDTVAIIDPYYATYPGTVRAASCKPSICKTKPSAGFQIDQAALQEACHDAKALLINSPNNPTGAIYNQASLDAIRQVCLDNDLWLISDEVYDTQTHGPTHISPRQMPDMAERTLAIGSLSKSHIMTGFRIGWLIAPADFITATTHLTNTTTYGVASFIQDAAVAALTHGDQAERETAALYTRRRNRALETLKDSNALRVSPPDGAMYVMLDIRSTGMSGKDFAHALLDTHHIAVMPGESFGTAAAGHIRIALTVEDDTLVEALKTIATFAASMETAS